MRRRIDSVLVANRGEIASRIIDAARTLGIRSIAVFSDADETAPFVAQADCAVRLEGRASSDTYLRGDLLIEIALAHGADAVHPGYGFLSENAEFATACRDAALVFVGPPPSAIALMGSKVEAKRLMADAGVPVLPGVTLTPTMSDGALLAAADEIGLPVIVKASFGGGGRGMRVVHDRSTLVEAVASAVREAESAFGDGSVFLERFVEAPRHVEIQIVADEDGSVATLFERECSIQRRHQKIVEEAPAPALDDALRDEMRAAAMTAARAVGYVNAGTVEFVLGPDGGFGFLEMNTRLQVEHPVTEMVTGVDLVALQFSIARGEQLPPEVRDAEIRGHAIEARLYAEDVDRGFLPVTGRIDLLRFPEAPWLRVDSGYRAGAVVTPHYDALLAKVVAWGANRGEALRRLTMALQSAEIHGVVTNRDLLVGILRDDDFRAGRIDTSFLDRRDAVALAARSKSSEFAVAHLVAASVADREARRASSPVPVTIPPGWRNVGPLQQRLLLDDGARIVGVALQPSHDGVTAVIDEDEHTVTVIEASTEHVVLELGGTRYGCAVQRVDDRVYVDSALESSAFTIVDPFPPVEADRAGGSLTSPLPGVVVAVSASVGEHVAAGEPLVVLEAMKMEHTVVAPHDGTVVEVKVAVGEQVETGAVLVVLDADAGVTA